MAHSSVEGSTQNDKIIAPESQATLTPALQCQGSPHLRFIRTRDGSGYWHDGGYFAEQIIREGCGIPGVPKSALRYPPDYSD